MSASALDRVQALLVRAGVTGEVTAVGQEGEILAVRVGAEFQPALARLAPEIRAAGFRYVAMELVGKAPNPGNS